MRRKSRFRDLNKKFGSVHGKVVAGLWDIVVSEVELQSRYYIISDK